MLGRKEIRQAFDKVDTDKSGSIDLSELENLCISLNHPVNAAEVTELFKEIDTNHDGKISFEEFTAWFRLGASTKLKGWLKTSLKSMAIFDQHRSKLTHEGTDAGEVVNLFNVEISEGSPEVDNTTFGVHFCTSCPELLATIADACPDYQGNADFRCWVVKTLKSKNPEALKQAIEDFIEFLKDTCAEQDTTIGQVAQNQKYSVGVSGDTVVLVIDLYTNLMLREFFGVACYFYDTFDQSGINFDMKFRTECSLKHLMAADNVWDHQDCSDFRMNLNCSKFGKMFAGNFASMAGPGMDSWLNMYNGFSMKCHVNNPKQSGSLYKNATEAMTE